MNEDERIWWRKRLLAAALQGLAGYINTSSSPSPQTRRLRFLWLFMPLFTQLVTRYSMGWKKGPDGEPVGTMNCLPIYLVMLGTAAYSVYVYISSRKRPS